MVYLLFLILAAISFGLAAFHVEAIVDWLPLGFMFVVIAWIVAHTNPKA